MEEIIDQIQVKAKTRHQMAREFGVNRKTFCRWLERANLNLPNGLICPMNVMLIYNTLGNPDWKNNNKDHNG